MLSDVETEHWQPIRGPEQSWLTNGSWAWCHSDRRCGSGRGGWSCQLGRHDTCASDQWEARIENMDQSEATNVQRMIQQELEGHWPLCWHQIFKLVAPPHCKFRFYNALKDYSQIKCQRKDMFCSHVSKNRIITVQVVQFLLQLIIISVVVVFFATAKWNGNPPNVTKQSQLNRKRDVKYRQASWANNNNINPTLFMTWSAHLEVKLSRSLTSKYILAPPKTLHFNKKIISKSK